NMKIDAIIGNPPYQVMDGGAGAEDTAAPIYHKFVTLSKQLSSQFISLIMPSKWMIGGRS
ncbi:Eco57I restriction-modification methylase domain-containing protein, partial [Capnocytophaga ochracea]|uniref:Eco57I restriction-modification methylase domain-containing protein n=1 Tax=Capnocytophaga ochracea TaxID=1018 RepID=UPI002B45B2D9